MEYFSDGITESIINALSKLPKLRVVARSIVFRYRRQDVDPLAVGQELDVRAVLAGRVQQSNGHLMIGAELIDVANGAQLWGERYNRKLSDVFAVQEEIAKQITARLRLKLALRDKKQLVKHYTENAEAYQAYLKGRYYGRSARKAQCKERFSIFSRLSRSIPAMRWLIQDSRIASTRSVGSVLRPRKRFSPRRRPQR